MTAREAAAGGTLPYFFSDRYQTEVDEESQSITTFLKMSDDDLTALLEPHLAAVREGSVLAGENPLILFRIAARVFTSETAPEIVIVTNSVARKTFAEQFVAAIRDNEDPETAREAILLAMEPLTEIAKANLQANESVRSTLGDRVDVLIDQMTEAFGQNIEMVKTIGPLFEEAGYATVRQSVLDGRVSLVATTTKEPCAQIWEAICEKVAGEGKRLALASPDHLANAMNRNVQATSQLSAAIPANTLTLTLSCGFNARITRGAPLGCCADSDQKMELIRALLTMVPRSVDPTKAELQRITNQIVSAANTRIEGGENPFTAFQSARNEFVDQFPAGYDIKVGIDESGITLVILKTQPE